MDEKLQSTINRRLGCQRRAHKKSQTPKSLALVKDPGTTYFRACKHYHWPCKLNVRVRNGYACFLASNSPGNHREDSGAALPCVYV